MSFEVLLTEGASRDLEALYDYIDHHDVSGKATHVLDQLESVFSSLSENPERGVYPKELVAIGLREYREVFFKPYRILYYKALLMVRQKGLMLCLRSAAWMRRNCIMNRSISCKQAATNP
jgi:toxin ParE1/3/4